MRDIRDRPNNSTSGNRSSIWNSLTNFSYNPSSPESWVRAGCQIAVIGMGIMLVKALDGSTCGRGWNVMVPQTWGTPAGCFVRSLTRNVPDTFLDTPQSAQPQQTGDLVEPLPSPTSTPPTDPYRQPGR